MQDLIDEVKEPITKFVIKALEIIKKKHPKTKSIIIQLNKDNIYIGKDEKGRYKSIYYDPTLQNNDKELEDLVQDNKKYIEECKDCIDDANPGNKMRSFNIFFHESKRTINICKNLIGNKGMTSCRLFNEIVL